MQERIWSLNRKAIYLFIFLSGVSALFYEIIWLRLLTLFFGVGSFAVATVVGTFMAGIALGSLIFGRASEKKSNLIKMYSYLELLIGVASLLAFLLLKNTEILHGIYYYFYNNHSFYSISLVRLVLSVFVLIIPSSLIGGTVPIVSKYLIQREDFIGRDFSKIYYINTFGAFIGVVLVSFFFIKHFGVNFSFFFAFLINLFIFLSLLAFSEKSYSMTEERGIEKQSGKRVFLFVAFFAGFIHIGYEVLWVRIFSVLTTGTTYVFPLVLSGFLLGFMLGSYLISRKIDNLQKPLRTFAYLETLIAFFGALILFSFRILDSLNVYIRESYNEFALLFDLTPPFILSFVPAVLMGAVFPLLIKMYARDEKFIGKKTGEIYFFSTLGSITSSFVVGFIFIPLFGMKPSTFILVFIGLCLAFFVFKRFLRTWKLITIAIISIITVISSNGVLNTSQNLIFYDEGLTATVSVEKINSSSEEYKVLRVDNQAVAATYPRLVIDSKILAHIPLLLSEIPKNVVTVGYGSGGTSYSMSQHGVKVYALEIEEKVVEASREFEEMNHGIEKNENLEIVLDDARNFLSATDLEFDVIATDVTNLKYKSNPSLYTVDYFKILDGKTSENGVVAAWIPMSFLAFEDLQTLINSFHEVFPHTTVWHYTKSPTHFLVLVGTKEKLSINLNELNERMKKVQKDLDEIKIENEYDFASMLFLGEEDVGNLVKDAKIHTDNLPVLEFSNIKEYYNPNQYQNLRKLLEHKKENLLPYFEGSEEEREILYEHFIASFKSIESQFALYVGDVEAPS